MGRSNSCGLEKEALRGNEWATFVNVHLLVNVNVPERYVAITLSYFRAVAAFCRGAELVWQTVKEKTLLQVLRVHNARLSASIIFGYVHVHAHVPRSREYAVRIAIYSIT